MGARFVHVDRKTPMLFSPVLQEWVPDDHGARLVVDLIESLDLSEASINFKGTGSRQYPPSMMLALLLYSYSGGIFSSRKIEEGTHDHVGMRYISGDHHPDHDTICKFRRENAALIKSVFRQTLQLAGEVGIIQIGEVDLAGDGCKVAANLSEKENKNLSQIQAEIEDLETECKQIEQTVTELLKKAEKTDKREAREAFNLPPELQDPTDRAKAIEEAKKRIAKKKRRKAKLEAAREEFTEGKKKKAQEREELRDEVRQSEVGHVPG